jgi:SAM-dependent methyltransferase
MYRKVHLLLILLVVLCANACKREFQNREFIELKHHQHGDSSQHNHDHNANSGVDIDDEPNFKDLISDFEAADRVIWQKPDMIIRLLGNIQTKVVADLGAGSGYFSFRLVDNAQKVIAIDVDPNMISWMDSIAVEKLTLDQQTRFETRLADYDNSKLKQREVDAILIVNTYHQIQGRVAYFRQLLSTLKPGGSVLIIDYKKKKLPPHIGPPSELKIAVSKVEEELEESGFEDVVIDDRSLDYQYIIMAKTPFKN